MTHGVEKSLTAPDEKYLFRHFFVKSPILKKENGNSFLSRESERCKPGASSGLKQQERASQRPLFSCGTTGIRTRDTRIFSPMLYQLSYGTKPIILPCFSQSGCKGRAFFRLPKHFSIFFCICTPKKHLFLLKTTLSLQKIIFFLVYSFGLHYLCPRIRKVAQLVAHYVRDVGVGRSSRLFPTMLKRFGLIHHELALLFSPPVPFFTPSSARDRRCGCGRWCGAFP